MAVPRRAERRAKLEIARSQVPDTRHTLGLRTVGNGGYDSLRPIQPSDVPQVATKPKKKK